MNPTIDYKEGDHDEFIHYLFSSEPKPKDSIQLELCNEDETKNIYHHVFEQLLMIFVDGLKYFYGDSDGKVSIDQLSEQDIDKAIKRIPDNTYGYCEETGEPIGLKRLIARPIATLSIEAQEKHEKNEKVFADL